MCAINITCKSFFLKCISFCFWKLQLSFVFWNVKRIWGNRIEPTHSSAEFSEKVYSFKFYIDQTRTLFAASFFIWFYIAVHFLCSNTWFESLYHVKNWKCWKIETMQHKYYIFIVLVYQHFSFQCCKIIDICKRI